MPPDYSTGQEQWVDVAMVGLGQGGGGLNFIL